MAATLSLRTSRTRWPQLIANWLALLVLVSLGVVWPPLFASELASEPADIRTGSLLLKSGPDAEPVEALRLATKMSAHITGSVARVIVTQEFQNAGDDWVEGLYVFPLSTTAAVDELLMHVGERTIRGEIKRKEEARATYEQARNEGKRASLVDQERPNMFSTTVANIAPHSSITVEIAYLDTIAFRDGRYTLNLPLAITPRYTPGALLDPAAPNAAEFAKQANAVLGVNATPERVTRPQQKVSIDVELAPGFPIEFVKSLHHAVVLADTPLGKRIRLESHDVPADRDFELIWKPIVAPETHAAVFAEKVGEETYALVTLMPPEMTTAKPERREVLFIIDTSGSMHGASIEQARAALKLGVDRLGQQDRFNVIRFSNDATRLFAIPQIASDVNRKLAGDFIASLEADGGTEMRAALDLAFSMPVADEILRQIVFITDGSVSNEADLISLIHSRIGSSRLFTVGIGAAPNAYFMREAAAAGRGSYTFIAQADEVRDRMADLFRKLEQPALVGLELHWPGDAAAELAADVPRDVYAGDPLLVVARLPRTPQGMLTLSGRSNGRFWMRQMPVTLVSEQSGIAKLWARERIGELSRRKAYSPDAARIDARIVELALQHHLVSDLTSLVAVDETPVRPAEAPQHSEQAPTSAPAGGYWASTSTGFAKTATPASLLLLIGLFAFAAAAMLQFFRLTPSASMNRAARSNYSLHAGRITGPIGK